ncbi:MAG: aspartate dehydrogenase [Rhodospirillales bacterium]|nr:aspartate dehydrogenase [Rhodospirillales bacterium]
MSKELRVAVGGMGGIGSAVVRRLQAGIPGLRLVAVSARDQARARERLAALGAPVDVVGLGDLADRADIVVEAVPSAFFRAIAEPAIERGRLLMPLSVGALLDHFDLVARARETGARIHVPTGALIGLDAVRAAAEGTIHSVRMVTRKPPRSLAGAPHLEQKGISLDGLIAPLRVFEGTAREGARGFPANVNVAAALSLAGIGPDRTMLEIWADPALERNTHRIEVDSDSAKFSMTIENLPSAENPKTGRITALSVIAALRGLVAELRVGT